MGMGGSPRGVEERRIGRLWGVYSPTHYYVRVSRVEFVEMLDVPSILDGDPVLRL